MNVSIEQRARHAVLSISDNGVGTPPAINERRLSGLKMTEALVRQIRGTFVRAPASQGTTIEIGIPLNG